MADSKSWIQGTRINAANVNPELLTLVTKAWLQEQGLDETFFLYSPTAEDNPPDWLVKSVLRKGVKDPIAVHKYTINKQAFNLIAAGRKRYKAAMIAHEQVKDAGGEGVTVPVFPYKGSDVEMNALMIEENNLRVEDTAATKAKLAYNALQLSPGNYKQVAESFGVTVQTVRNWEKVFELPTIIQRQMLKSGKGMTAALELAKIEDKGEQMAAFQAIVTQSEASPNGKVTARKAAATAKGKASDFPGAKWEAKLIEWEKMPGDVATYLQWRRGEIGEKEAKKRCDWLREYMEDVPDA